MAVMVGASVRGIERGIDLIEFRSDPVHAFNIAVKAPWTPSGDAAGLAAAYAADTRAQLVAGVGQITVRLVGHSGPLCKYVARTPHDPIEAFAEGGSLALRSRHFI
jgi:hypothetical protein